MAIFSRRTLQRLLNENAEFLTRKQIRNHVDQLNRMPETLSLAHEWEVITLNAFSKLGQVSHERDLGGTSRPDIYFECNMDFGEKFIADITAVSDKGFEGTNSYNALFEELMLQVKKHSLRPESFSLQVEGNHGKLYRGGPKAKLFLPGAARFCELIFNEKFETFISGIKETPTRKSVLPIKNTQQEIDVTIGYDPSQTGATGGHLVYQRINDITKNTLYTALNSKADQLGKSGFEGLRGIILCDGGFTPFHDFPSPSMYSVKEVVKQFMQDRKEIDFVFLLVVEGMFSKTGCRLAPELYCGQTFSSKNPLIFEMLQQIPTFFPLPESDAKNAINYLRYTRSNNPNEGRSHWGGLIENEYEDNTMEIKISAKALLDILSGTVTQQEFFERHHFVPTNLEPQNAWNPFLQGLRQGKMISQVSFEKTVLEDDDWVVIKLAGPDPAISSFVVPSRENRTS